MKENKYTISEAARLLSVENHVLRYWEEELELNIPRNELGHRYYREEEIQLLHCIKELKNKGFQLKAVKEVLPDLEQKKLIDIHKLLTTQEELENQELEEAQKEGIDCEGPIVPDSLFVKVVKGQYAISVVMYHDQGLIPMKMESFGMGVNVTIGLPFVRTSVDHGTAFDIVGKNLADIGSLREAINLGNECAKIRKSDISRLAEVDYSN